MSRIYLGSQSKYRKRVLEEAGISCHTIAADIDEKAIRDSDPWILTRKLANAKTIKLLSQLPSEGYLICADQVVWWDGCIFEKPASAEEVHDRLTAHIHQPITYVNGICVTDLSTGTSKEISDSSVVHLKPFPSHIIESIAADPLTYVRAGVFDIQDPLIRPYIVSMDGDISSVLGLPIGPVRQALMELGYIE